MSGLGAKTPMLREERGEVSRAALRRGSDLAFTYGLAQRELSSPGFDGVQDTTRSDPSAARSGHSEQNYREKLRYAAPRGYEDRGGAKKQMMAFVVGSSHR